MKIALGYLATFGWVFLMLGLTALLKQRGKGEELGRKIVHISVAFTWIPMCLCFASSWHLVVPPAVMSVLNFISCRTGLFSGMERSDADKRTYGTFYYALSMTLMALGSVLWPRCLPAYGLGLFCMALGDGFAPFFGRIRRGNRPLIAGRTLYGSLGVFVLCLIVALVFRAVFALSLSPWELLLLAAAAALLELVGVRGLDNLCLPLGVFALTALLTR